MRISARESGPDVVIRVVDDGPGIPKADLERVFERFYQVERHRGQATTGLGLAICKHIVERHGGRIRQKALHKTKARPLFSPFFRPRSGTFMNEHLLARNVSVYYGQNKALHEVSLNFGAAQGYGPHWALWLRQINLFALPQPHE